MAPVHTEELTPQQFAFVYDAIYNHHKKHIEEFIQKADIQDGESVLDLGTGHAWVALAALEKTDREVVAVDINEFIIRLNEKEHINANIKFVRDDMTKLSEVRAAFPNRRFDVITCCWAFGAVDEDKRNAVLGLWKDMLTPRGRIVFELQHLDKRVFNHVILEALPRRPFFKKMGGELVLSGKGWETVETWRCATDPTIKRLRAKMKKIAARVGLQVVGSINVFPSSGDKKTDKLQQLLTAQEIANDDENIHHYRREIAESEIQKTEKAANYDSTYEKKVVFLCAAVMAVLKRA